MRFKYLRYLASALGGITAAVGAGALYLHVTFDGTRLASDLTLFAKQRYQRTLHFDGPIELRMFPRVELHLPATTLSVRGGEGDAAAFASGRVGVRLGSLLAREVVAAGVELDGLRMIVVRGKDGKLSIADLLAPLPDDAPAGVDLDRLVVHNGSLNWLDEASERPLALTEIELATDRLAEHADGRLEISARLTQAAAQQTDARIALSTGYRIDDALRLLRGLRFSANGQLLDHPATELELSIAEFRLPADSQPQAEGFSLQARQQADARSAELRLAASRLTLRDEGPEAADAAASLRLDTGGEGGTLRARLAGVAVAGKRLGVNKLDLDLDWKRAEGRLAGSLTGKLGWQQDAQVLEVSPLTGKLGYTAAGAGAVAQAVTASLDGKFDLARDAASGKLDVRVADTRVQGAWRLPRLSAGSFGFDLDVDRLDADRAFGPFDGATPLSLGGMAGLDAEGVLRMTKLRLGGLRFDTLNLPLSLHGGVLNATAATGTLYGGSLDASFGFVAADSKTSLRAYLQNANVGALLRDVGGREPLLGVLNCFVEANGAGKTVAELRQNLAGQGRLRLRNGVVRGIDVPAAWREWRGAIQAHEPAKRPYREAETTAVGEVTGSFQLASGRIRVADLQSRTASLALAGSGEAELGGSHLDLLTRVTLLAFAPADMQALASLRGVVVPLRATGSPGRPEWRVDPGAQGGVTTLKVAPLKAPPRPVPKPIPKPRPKPAPAASPAATEPE